MVEFVHIQFCQILRDHYCMLAAKISVVIIGSVNVEMIASTHNFPLSSSLFILDNINISIDKMDHDFLYWHADFICFFAPCEST